MLELDGGCRANMLWRTELPPGISTDTVVARMLEAGYASLNPTSFVYTIEDPDGHLLVIVPRTGRVQIRLDFETPKPRRAAVAADVHRRLLAFCSSAEEAIARATPPRAP